MADKSEERHERRQRKKKLINEVRQLLEFYFSPANLKKDLFMKELLAKDPFINLTIFHKFNKLKTLTTDLHILKKAITTSEVLKLSEDRTGVARAQPYQEKENELECTIYIENIPLHADHDWVKNVFSQYGTIDYISIPRFKVSGRPKGFAFVEFRNAEEAQQALAAFGGLAFHDVILKPGDLLSIRTHDKEEPVKETEPRVMKRPLEDSSVGAEKEDLENVKKKIRTDDGNTEQGPPIKKKKKRKRNKKEKEYEVDGIYLRVMSKSQWKSLRNNYLDMQRGNYKQAKQWYSTANYFSNTFSNQDGSNSSSAGKAGESGMPVFMPNVILRLIENPPPQDIVAFRNTLLEKSQSIAFIDAKPQISDVFIRFKTAEGAAEFLQNSGHNSMSLLGGDDEATYWEHIYTSWLKTRPKKKKTTEQCNPDNSSNVRGREKLIKKAWKQPPENTHVIFDE